MYKLVHFMSNVKKYMFTLVVWEFQVPQMSKERSTGHVLVVLLALLQNYLRWTELRSLRKNSIVLIL